METTPKSFQCRPANKLRVKVLWSAKSSLLLCSGSNSCPCTAGGENPKPPLLSFTFWNVLNKSWPFVNYQCLLWCHRGHQCLADNSPYSDLGEQKTFDLTRLDVCTIVNHLKTHFYPNVLLQKWVTSIPLKWVFLKKILSARWWRVSITSPNQVTKKPNQHPEEVKLPTGIACFAMFHIPQASASNLSPPFFHYSSCWGWGRRGVGSLPSSRTSWALLCKNLLAYAPPLIPDGNYSSLRCSTPPTRLQDLFNPSFMLVHLPPCVHTSVHADTHFHSLPTTKYLIWQYEICGEQREAFSSSVYNAMQRWWKWLRKPEEWKPCCLVSINSWSENRHNGVL